MGSGGPSTRTIVEAADITREKSPKRIGPLAVPKAMSSTASATLATPFGIKGINYTITSACATSKHCIGNGYEQIQLGKQDIVFAGGHEDLDWTLSMLFDAMGAMSSDFNDTPARARAPMTATATASSSPAAPASSCSRNAACLRARRRPRRDRRLRRDLGRPHMVAPSGEGAERCMRLARVGAPVDHIKSTPPRRRGRPRRSRRSAPSSATAPADLGHQVADGQSLGRAACRNRSTASP